MCRVALRSGCGAEKMSSAHTPLTLSGGEIPVYEKGNCLQQVTTLPGMDLMGGKTVLQNMDDRKRLAMLERPP